jgi:LDH2 family malate/lactate/ureidoglycolate dehydrogenase
MDHAIDLAKEYGVGAVAVRNSNHSGMLASHVLRACAAGCVGHFVSNAPATMAPTGGAQAVLSNAPMAWGVPTGGGEPIVLDMASSAAARSKIRLAAREGRTIPAEWAVGPDGVATTDPQVALDGVLLPMAGHKGSGLAIVNELLCSALPGATFAARMPTDFLGAGATTMEGWDAGHLAVAIDPSALQPLERFYERVEDLVRTIRGSGIDVMLPGEPESRLRQQREAEGIPLSAEVFGDLQAFAEEVGFEAI